jgi:dephospho-CoA kinase
MIESNKSTGTLTAATRGRQRGLLRLGLTGGIATGKTTVLDMLRARSAKTIDTDEIARAVLRKDTDVWQAVVEAFGRGVLGADGDIDRARLADIVFADAEKRELLNKLMHPAIRREWLTQVDALQKNGFAGIVAVCVPLLYEVGVESQFEAVLVVACSEKTQIERLRQRGLTEPQARQRIAAQLPSQEKMTRADFVIWNETPLPTLERQVALIWNQLNRYDQ